MRVLVTADTHIPDFARRLPEVVLREAERADLVVHAGDVTSPAVLDALAAAAPVLAVRGNNDGPDVAAWGASEAIQTQLDGVPIAVIHDAGPAKGRPARMRRRFPAARLVIYGHSHIPIDVEEAGVRLLNPGSPTWKRRQPTPTFAIVEIHKRTLDVQLVELDVRDPEGSSVTTVGEVRQPPVASTTRRRPR
jgi:putative phosphoesterase